MATQQVSFSASYTGVVCSQDWRDVPAYENWEFVIESFQTIMYQGIAFDFPQVVEVTVYPKLGKVEIIMQSRKIVVLEFMPNSLGSCRLAFMEYLHKVLGHKLPIQRAKEPAKLSGKGSRVL